MSYDSHLIHLCTISRPSATTLNAHGLGEDTLAVLEDSQRCRLVVTTEAVSVTQLAEAPVLTHYTLLLPANADISIDDHITAVELEDGTVLTDRFVVMGILPRRGRWLRHITVNLKKVA